MSWGMMASERRGNSGREREVWIEFEGKIDFKRGILNMEKRNRFNGRSRGCCQEHKTATNGEQRKRLCKIDSAWG